MGKIQELFNTRVRPMVPAERLQLARLNLDDLTRSESDVDVSDGCGEDDPSEVAAYSAQHANQKYVSHIIIGAS